MDQFEATTHPFIVRIWLEETTQEADQATWRGYVTHVPSGEQCYIHDLNEIVAFIAPYVERMGVRLPGTRPADGLSARMLNLRQCIKRVIGLRHGRRQG